MKRNITEDEIIDRILEVLRKTDNQDLAKIASETLRAEITFDSVFGFQENEIKSN